MSEKTGTGCGLQLQIKQSVKMISSHVKCSMNRSNGGTM